MCNRLQDIGLGSSCGAKRGGNNRRCTRLLLLPPRSLLQPRGANCRLKNLFHLMQNALNTKSFTNEPGWREQLRTYAHVKQISDQLTVSLYTILIWKRFSALYTYCGQRLSPECILAKTIMLSRAHSSSDTRAAFLQTTAIMHFYALITRVFTPIPRVMADLSKTVSAKTAKKCCTRNSSTLSKWLS